MGWQEAPDETRDHALADHPGDLPRGERISLVENPGVSDTRPMDDAHARAYCEGGPYDTEVWPLDERTRDSGFLIFEGGPFSPRNRPRAVYRASDRQTGTPSGPARVFEYDAAATQHGVGV